MRSSGFVLITKRKAHTYLVIAPQNSYIFIPDFDGLRWRYYLKESYLFHSVSDLLNEMSWLQKYKSGNMLHKYEVI
jgi:hypothetical protein